jgi:hypothetical protein
MGDQKAGRPIMRKRRTHARVHNLILTVTLDRPCTPTEAARIAKDLIWGEFYPSAWGEREGFPELLKVKAIRKRKRGEDR